MNPESEPIDLSSEKLNSPEQERIKPIDALVVFGFGSLSDKNLEEMARGNSLIGKQEQGWRLPLGAKLRIMAAAELYQSGQANDVIMSEGTKTSEGMTISGAELMKKYFKHVLESQWRNELMAQQTRGEKGEISQEDRTEIERELIRRWQEVEPHIFSEDKATNTIENFAYTTNFLNTHKDKYQNIALLSSDFHINRILKLADKFMVSGKGVGSETAIDEPSFDPRLKRIAERYFNPSQNDIYRKKVLADLSGEKMKIREKRLGTSVGQYIKEEKKWSRALDEIPEYWLSCIRFVENSDHLKRMLQVEEKVQEVLRKRGIEDIEAADAGQIKEVLGSIQRIGPPKEWENE